MQTPNGKNIDNYWNRYDTSKEYREILFRDGYGTRHQRSTSSRA